jgi:hypothetical protein
MSGPLPSKDPVLTLEPFLEAVREGLEKEGWELSGLQKTTSYEFEGRWAGDSSRSAYLFFHRPELGDWTSIDVFLDETSKGLKGNLALVLDGPALRGIPDPEEVFRKLGGVAGEALPKGYRTPLTLRYRLSGPGKDPGEADSEIRFKLYFPRKVIQSGSRAISELAQATSLALLKILQSPELTPYLPPVEEGEGEVL